MVTFILSFVVAAGGGPFDGLGKMPVLTAYKAGSDRGILDVPAGGTVLTRQTFVAKSEQSDVKSIEVTAFRFQDPKAIKKAVSDTYLHVQAATVRVTLPEFSKSGFEFSYLGNPTIVKARATVGHVWVELRLTRKQKTWNPQSSSNRAQDASDNIRKDATVMVLLKKLLPDLHARAEKADGSKT